MGHHISDKPESLYLDYSSSCPLELQLWKKKNVKDVSRTNRSGKFWKKQIPCRHLLHFLACVDSLVCGQKSTSIHLARWVQIPQWNLKQIPWFNYGLGIKRLIVRRHPYMYVAHIHIQYITYTYVYVYIYIEREYIYIDIV